MKKLKRRVYNDAVGVSHSGGKNKTFKPVFKDELVQSPNMNTKLDGIKSTKVVHLNDDGDIAIREALRGFEDGNHTRLISSPIIRQAIGYCKGRFFAPDAVQPLIVSPATSADNPEVVERPVEGYKIASMFARWARDKKASSPPVIMTFWRIPDAFGALSPNSLVFQVATFGGKTSDPMLWDPSFMHPDSGPQAKSNILDFFSEPGLQLPALEKRANVEEIAAAFDFEESEVANRGNKFIPQLFLECINALSNTWKYVNRHGKVVVKANLMADTTIPAKRVRNWMRNAPVTGSPAPVEPVSPPDQKVVEAVSPEDLAETMKRAQLERPLRLVPTTVNMDD